MCVYMKGLLTEEQEQICADVAKMYDPNNPRPANEYLVEKTGYLHNSIKFQLIDRCRMLIRQLD